MSSIKLLKLLKGRGKNEREIDIKNKTIVLIFFFSPFYAPQVRKKIGVPVWTAEPATKREISAAVPRVTGVDSARISSAKSTAWTAEGA